MKYNINRIENGVEISNEKNEKLKIFEDGTWLTGALQTPELKDLQKKYDLLSLIAEAIPLVPKDNEKGT